jgi:hypothetical protein
MIDRLEAMARMPYDDVAWTLFVVGGTQASAQEVARGLSTPLQLVVAAHYEVSQAYTYFNNGPHKPSLVFLERRFRYVPSRLRAVGYDGPIIVPGDSTGGTCGSLSGIYPVPSDQCVPGLFDDVARELLFDTCYQTRIPGEQSREPQLVR